MVTVIEDLGGPSAVARIVNVKPPSVIGWRRHGIPADRCPDLERASEGKHTCESMRPDVRWHRVPDAAWPWHPLGRPLIDVAATEHAQSALAVDAADKPAEPKPSAADLAHGTLVSEDVLRRAAVVHIRQHKRAEEAAAREVGDAD